MQRENALNQLDRIDELLRSVQDELRCLIAEREHDLRVTTPRPRLRLVVADDEAASGVRR